MNRIIFLVIGLICLSCSNEDSYEKRLKKYNDPISEDVKKGADINLQFIFEKDSPEPEQDNGRFKCYKDDTVVGSGLYELWGSTYLVEWTHTLGADGEDTISITNIRQVSVLMQCGELSGFGELIYL